MHDILSKIQGNVLIGGSIFMGVIFVGLLIYMFATGIL